MLTKPIKTAVKSIKGLHFVKSPAQTSIHTSLGICGIQFASFAKSILDKYTKVLNYQFDYTSLVFLEQVANEGERYRQGVNNTIIVTWKLLSFLLNHETRQKQFLYESPVVLKQIIQKMEQNLSIIKSRDQEVYQNMMKCYAVYERQMEAELIGKTVVSKELNGTIVTAENNMTSYHKVIDYVEEQIKLYDERQQTEALIKREKTQTEVFMAPFIMSRSFFINLNHLVNDNKTVSYKQIWQQSVSQQLEQYYLDLHMKKFRNEQDAIKKEEMVLNMFQEFGSERVQEYLNRTDEALYEQFIHIMYTLVGEHDIPLEQTYYATKKKQTEYVKNGKKIKKYSDWGVINRDTKGKENAKDISVEEYSFSHRTLLLAEYKQKENIIMDILDNSEEITRNILLSKVEEYKELFYEYSRSILNQTEIEQQSQEQNNPEIFTDYELKIMLDTVDEKNIAEKKEFLEQKLNLFAMKEITESLLKEKTNLLQKNYLQLVYKELEPLSFVNDNVKEMVEKNKGYVSKTERETSKRLFVKLKNQFGQLQNKSIRRVVEAKIIGGKVVKGKGQEFYADDIRHIFENGTLPERKLFYLALEQTMDQMIIEKHNQLEEQKVLETLIQAKQRLIQEKDSEKRVIDDWRFLMTKQRSHDIIQVLSGLQLETRKQLEQLVQEKAREFYSKLSEKEKMQQFQKVGQGFLPVDNGSAVEMVQKKIVLVKKIGENTFANKQKKYYNLTKNMKFTDVVDIFETGSFSERKLMYLALKNSILSIDDKKEERTQHFKSILSKAHVSEIKDALRYERKEIYGKNVSKSVWLNQEQNEKIMRTLVLLNKTEKDWLEVELAQQIQKLLFHKRTQFVNSYIKEENNTKTNTEFENVISGEKNTKKMNKNLKIRHLYDRIKEKQLFEENIYEKTREKFSRSSFSSIHLEIPEKETRLFHQMAKHLKKDDYLLLGDENIQMDLLTQKNNDFMQPPTEKRLSVEKERVSQATLEKQIKYHEESVKLILNHTKDKTESKKEETLYQETILKELKGNLLDYKMQLEDKGERLEMVEKQLQNQGEKLQRLSESQIRKSQKNLKSAEAREFMKHLKNEMKMEQMRSGNR